MSNTVPTSYASVPFEEYEALLELRSAVRSTLASDGYWQRHVRSEHGDDAVFEHLRQRLAEVDARIDAVRPLIGSQP